MAMMAMMACVFVRARGTNRDTNAIIRRKTRRLADRNIGKPPGMPSSAV